MARLKNVLLSAALIGALGVFAAACDDDAETQNNAQQSDVDALQASIDEVNARLSRDEMMYAIIEINSLGLHEMNEGLLAGNIETSYAPNTRTAIRLLALTDWSDDMQADADAIHDHAVDALQALEDENVEAAAAAATELHEGYHAFTDKVWREVAADLPADAGGVEAHDDSDASTPAADETPDDHGGEGTPDGGHMAGETPAADATP